MTDEVAAPHPVSGPTLEVLARAIHDAYLRAALEDGLMLRSQPALCPWRDLPEHLKEANRAQARGYAAHLATVGYEIVPASGDLRERVSLPRSQLERLARAEHQRWVEHKLSQGYRYGDSRVEDGERRLHPSLVPWEALPEEIRELDRQPLRRMSETLASADLRVVPRRR